MSSKEKVVVAMSGGVDSSVAAALLIEQGFNVIGVMLHLWSESGKECENKCCTPQAMLEARSMSAQLGIPFYELDAAQVFRESIVQYFLDGYSAGVTPNPCVRCNQQIKWGMLLDYALSLGADYLATGHYAIVSKDETGQAHLFRAKDYLKDQSYVMSLLKQSQLQRTLFPLGGLSKPEVREMARQRNLSVAEKQDSQDLCFVTENDYRDFLSRYVPDASQPGPILDRNGKQLGQHQGLAFYTIGQRKGIRVVAPRPYYVLRKEISANALIVGEKEELIQSEMFVDEVNWISGTTPSAPLKVRLKIRYKSDFVDALVYPESCGTARAVFNSPVASVTAGQFAVFYNADEVLGGGVIR